MEQTVSPSRLLQQVEKFIQETQVKNSKTIRGFLSEIKEDFNKELEDHLQSKRFYFIRHSEAAHNTFIGWIKKLMKKRKVNPKLSLKGVEQCIGLTEKLNKLKSNVDFECDAVFISPLERTLQTFFLIKDSKIFKNTKSFIVTDLIRERLKTKSQVGAKLTELKESLRNADYLNLDYIVKEEWWNYDDGSDTDEDTKDRKETEVEGKMSSSLKIERENREDIDSRLILFLIWIILKQEKSIVIVSHSYIYKWITNKTKRISTGDFNSISHDMVVSLIKQYL